MCTSGVFLDFSKAFDIVNHEILLNQLESYGIRGLPFKFFNSYLTNRQQYVKLGNFESPKQIMICGIPQGSTLGPLVSLLGFRTSNLLVVFYGRYIIVHCYTTLYY